MIKSIRSLRALLLLAGATSLVAYADVGVNKSFNPISASVGQISTLTIDLLNDAATPATGTALTDALPAGIVIATPPNASTTCGAGTVTAVAGSTSVALSGGTIPAASGVPGQCTITVDVVSNTANNYANFIPVGAVTSSQGSNTEAAQASLTYVALTAVAGTKAFAPANIHGGGVSTLTITLPNSNGVALTAVSVTDPLPAQLVIANPTNLSTTCASGTVTGASGAASVGLSGAMIPANGSCTITVNVTTATPNTFFNNNVTNTIPAGNLTSTQGVTNTVISGVIRVQTSAQVTKAFAPTPIFTGQTSVLTITLNNFNTTAMTPLTFTDTLPAGMVTTGTATTTCGGGAAVSSTANSVSLTGGSLAAAPAAAGSTTCTVTVSVIGTNAGTTAITLVNTIPAGSFGSETYPAATGNLVVNPNTAIAGSKTFTGTAVQTGVLSLVITLTNRTAVAATITSFLDNLNTMGAGFTIAAAPAATTTCVGGVITAVAGTTPISMAGGVIPASGNCTITVPVAVAANAATGARTNTIAAGAVVTNQGSNELPITGAVTIAAALAVTKSFSPTPVFAGTASTLTITLTRAANASSLSSIAFTDTLPAGHVVASPTGASTTCGGTLTAVAGSGSVSLAGGSLAGGAAATSCKVIVNVQTPSGSAGSATNTIPIGGVTTAEGVSNVAAASGAIARVTNFVSLSKGFNPTTVAIGGTSTLSLQILNNNPSNTALSSVALTDALPVGMQVAAIPNPSFTGGGCTTGTITAPVGATSVGLSGATITAGAVCLIKVDVVTLAAGNLINQVPANIVTTAQGTSNVSPTSATLTATGTADLSVTKDDGVTSAVAGTSVTYVVTVTNNGPNAVAGASFVDNEPAGESFTSWTCTPSASAVCPAASGTGPISGLVTLPVGGNVKFSVVAAIAANATGTVTNMATVTAPGAVVDPTLSNNTSSDTDTILNQADLQITKDDGATTYTPGGTTTYTIVARNVGPSSVIGATIADTLPAAISSDTWVAVQTGGASGFSASGSGSISDTVNMAVGSTITYVVTANISAAATGNLVNTATITSPVGSTDPNTANNSATDTDTVLPSADLGISKDDGSTTYTPGGTTTYTIVVTNGGPSTAVGAKVVDTLPAAISSDNWTATATGGATGFSVTGSGNINDTVTMPVGSRITYTVVAQISAAASGNLVNTAQVSAPVGTTDSNATNNSATDTDTPSPSADLVVTKDDGSTTYTPGGATTYTVTVTNKGPSAVTGAKVIDTMPAAITSDNWTATTTGGANGFSATGTGSINDTVNMPLNSTITYVITANISPTATGDLVNSATASVPTGTTDPTPGNNTGSDTDTSSPSADLTITKDDGATTYTPGGTTTYTVVVTNKGPSAVTGAKVIDTMPAAITSDTWTATTTGGATGFSATGTGNISDTVTMPLNSTITYVITAQVNASATGDLVNTASASVPTGTTDPTPGDNSATDTDTAAASADLGVTKTDGSTTYTPGNNVVYTIVVTNHGPSDVIGAAVSDPLPAGITTANWTCVASAGSSCTASGSGAITDSVNLKNAGTATYTATLAVPSTFNGDLVNVATATVPVGTTDPDSSNNTGTDTDTVNAQSSLAITKDDGSATYTPGGTATYDIVVTNAGPSDASAVAVSDPLPAGEALAGTPTCTVNGTGSCGNLSGNAGDTTFSVAAATVAAGAGNSLTFHVPVAFDSSLTAATIANTANVSAPSDAGGPHSATDTDTLAAHASLAATKTDGSTFYTPGASAMYTITVVNNGPSDAHGVEVDDTLPAGVSIAGTASCTPNGDASCGSVGGSASAVNIVGASIAAGAGNSLTILVPVQFSAGLTTNPLVNTVSFSDPTDPDASPATPGTTSDSDALAATSGLSISKDDGSATYTPGGTATYTVTVLNAGPSDAGALSVSDLLPTGVVLAGTPGCTINGTATCGTITGAVGGSSFGTTGATLSAGAVNSLVFELPVRFSADLVTNPLVNSASVSDPSDPSGPHIGTDSDTPKAVTALRVTKDDASLTYTPGNTATYTVTVTNAGPSDSSAVEVSDALPAGVTLTATPSCVPAGTATCGSISGAAGDGAFGASGGAIAAGAGNSLAFSVPVQFAANLSTNPLVNTALASDSTTAPAAMGSDSDTLQSATGLTITKDDGSATYTPGGSATYTITLTNAGPSSASDVSVSDALPDGVTLSALPTCTAIGAASCGTASGTVGGSNFGATGVSIPAGAGNRIVFTVPVDFAPDLTADPLANTVKATDNGSGQTVQSTDSDTLKPLTALVVVKDDGQLTYTPGGTGIYVITVANGGPSDATGVTVTDPLPPNVSLTAVPTCVASGAAVCGGISGAAGSTSFAVAGASVAAGAGNSLSYSLPVAFAAALSASPLVNRATASDSSGAPPVSGSDSDTRMSSTGFTITKTDGSNTYTPGGSATYVITVSNAGPSDAEAMALTDPLPTGVTLTATPTCTPSGLTDCGDITGASGDTSFAVANAVIPVGASLTYQVTVAFASSMTADPLVNVATVSDANTPGSTQMASDSDGLGAQADLAITKTDGTTSYIPGSNVTYTIVATNNGLGDVVGATVSDPLPAGITTASWTCLPGVGASCAANSSGAINDSTVNLPAGSSVTYMLTLTVPPAFVGNLVNTATVAAPPGVTDTNPNNNSATDTDTQGAQPDLTIAKVHTGDFTQGQTGAMYTITVSNVGGAASSGTMSITDTLPNGLTGTDISGSGWTCDLPSLSCTRNDAVAAGQSFPVITLTVTVSATAPSSLTNTVIVSGGGDANPNNNSASDPTTILTGGTPDLGIAKSHLGDFAQGQIGAVYTISVTNIGTAATSGVVSVIDTLPMGLSATEISGTGWDCTLGTLTCIRSDALAVNASYPVISLIVNVDINAPLMLTNIVTVSGGGDSTPANNTASDPTTITPAGGGLADLVVVKHGPATATVGGNISYTITVTNNGPATAVNTVLDDPTPIGLSFVSSGAACPTGFPCSLGTLAAGQSVTVSNIVFAIPAGFLAATVINTASASSDTPDPTPNNNSSSISATINATPSAPERVPVDARWMLLAMLVLLGGVGAAGLRARRR